MAMLSDGDGECLSDGDGECLNLGEETRKADIGIQWDHLQSSAHFHTAFACAGSSVKGCESNQHRPWWGWHTASNCSGTLQFSTGTGIYTISSIDYNSSTIIVTDPLMSTCSSMQNSGSFSLDKSSPFTIGDQNIFVLLGCSTTSPVFDPNEDLCDTGSGTRVCRGLYSCKGVAGIGLPQNAPISTCCVYDSEIVVGSGYALDLPKLQCSSYTSVYEFGDEGDPTKWRFGISLQYNDSYHTNKCKDCETSGGICGFAGLDQSFACICRSGVNTTTNCFGRGYAWSGAVDLDFQVNTIIGGLLLSWALLFLCNQQIELQDLV